MKITHTEDYAKLRAAEYPPLGDQLDLLWKLLAPQAAALPEAKAMLQQITAIKAKYKKPG